MTNPNSQFAIRNSLPPQPFDEAAQETARLLISQGVWRTTPKGRGAYDSVYTALEAGWTGTQCLECVQAWLQYVHTPHGSWVQFPGRQAAARLRDQQMPTYPVAPQDDPRRYIQSEYGDLIQH